jgi:hypothetical protein
MYQIVKLAKLGRVEIFWFPTATFKYVIEALVKQKLAPPTVKAVYSTLPPVYSRNGIACLDLERQIQQRAEHGDSAKNLPDSSNCIPVDHSALQQESNRSYQLNPNVVFLAESSHSQTS